MRAWVPWLGLVFGAAVAAAAEPKPFSLPVVLHRSGPVRTGVIPIPRLRAALTYSVLLSIRSPGTFGASSRLEVDLRQGGAELVHKTLHIGDPDLYAVFHVPRDGSAELRLKVVAKLERAGVYDLRVNRWPGSPDVEKEPNNRWQDANSIALGGVVFGSADDVAYIPPAGTPAAAAFDDPAGEDWFRFEFHAAGPRLVFFQLEPGDRDNVPADVAVFRVAGGEPVPYADGMDPVSGPHEAQAVAANEFTTRVLREPGTYYIRVRANHPAYELRTRMYDVPPFADPRQAVQTAIDYIIGAGDSWHANTPRRGGRLDRVESVHQETSLCVACHPTHFSQRAQLYAIGRGYAIHQRRQLEFLAERFYNNPRPFYGFEREGAVWARMISAPANVLSRMAVLLDLFESGVTGEPRPWFHNGVAGYLRLYYRGRTALPPDETNGNTPLVSAYEVAWYSWRVLRDERIASLIEQDAVKNMADLCYQTLALADINREKYKDRIRANAERILSLERPDGQWAMRFEPDQPEAEFQTGHALWALEAAGVPRRNPGVAKAIRYLLARQQEFGGWMDPKQSYENFRTPFRETQMAVLGLSAYYPAGAPQKGWQAPARELPADPAQALHRMEEAWDPPDARTLAMFLEAASANDPLIRREAVEALGRFGLPATLDTLAAALGDASKLVQRSAAWAVRQVYSRHDGVSPEPLEAALRAANDRQRWGATGVFASHFAALARHAGFARALAADLRDPVPTIRMRAARGLWQFWFWSASDDARGGIEDSLLSALAEPQHPWVELNLRSAVYNISDENIRYFYNNWVPLLARPEDRQRAIEGRLAVERRLSGKFAAVLAKGTDRQRKALLAALTEFPLRRPKPYSEMSGAPEPPVYNRIGNDIEQIAFFGAGAETFSAALEPLVSARDPELARLARNASLLVRHVSYPGVNEVAGEAGPRRRDLVERLMADATTAPEIRKAFEIRGAQTTTASRSARPAASEPLDPRYFQLYVRPILEKPGRDGYACVQCHATHTRFNGTYSTALNVVDRQDPENSLILRKPTSSSETEGVAGSKILAHGGGVRWEKNSPEYRTILNWIRGARP